MLPMTVFAATQLQGTIYIARKKEVAWDVDVSPGPLWTCSASICWVVPDCSS